MSNASDFEIENGVLTKYMGPGGDVVIPEGVTSIGDGAFDSCRSLKNVVIPQGVSSIGVNAFFDCYRLKRVEIPQGVTSIGDGAFDSCKSLQSVEIPQGVSSIGVGAFFECYRLKSVMIPEGVTSICNHAFCSCGSLQSVEIPQGVTSIYRFTFSGCRGLKSVVIPEGVSSIGEGAFNICESLESVVIPEGVTSIGNGAFDRCKSLKSIVIPQSVISIGEDAFEGCEKLEYISPLNQSCKMAGKTFTNCPFPSKLHSCLGGIYHAMTDSVLKDALINLNWSQLDPEMQMEIFVNRQGKPLLSAYPECIQGKEVESLGRRLLDQLSRAPAVKLCKAAANYMILLEKDIPDDLLNQLYTSLKGQKNAARALKTVEDHVSLYHSVAPRL